MFMLQLLLSVSSFSTLKKTALFDGLSEKLIPGYHFSLR